MCFCPGGVQMGEELRNAEAGRVGVWEGFNVSVDGHRWGKNCVTRRLGEWEYGRALM